MYQLIENTALRLANENIWTNRLMLARAFIALGTLLTLVFTPIDVLFHPVAGISEVPQCGGIFRISIFCLLANHLQIAVVICCLVLLWVLSGFYAQIAAFFHWWVSASVIMSATLIEGGDHLASILTLLLLPILVLDPRRNTWGLKKESSKFSFKWKSVIAGVAYWLIRLQVAIVYLHAATGKMKIEEWMDGTATYYWFTDDTIGLAPWLEPIFTPFLLNPFIITSITWGTIIFELILFSGLFMPVGMRKKLFRFGVLFHIGIAVVHGLITFGLIMVGALILYLLPLEEEETFSFSKTAPSQMVSN